MKKFTVASAACAFLAGCIMSEDEIAQNYGPESAWGQAWQACDAAPTMQAAFGTPVNPGPCWGQVNTISRSQNVAVYQMTTIQNRQAIVTYTNGRLTSATVGS